MFGRRGFYVGATMRFKHSRRTQRSSSTGKRRKRAQRIRGSAHSGDSFRRGRFRRASGGHIFSLATEKIWKKRVLGRVWCLLRVRFRQALIFSRCEHTYSPYGRYGTRRLLRYTRFVNSCDSISAVKTPFVQNLQGSTDSPEFCRGRCLHRPAGELRIRRKISEKALLPAGRQSRRPLRDAERIHRKPFSFVAACARSTYFLSGTRKINTSELMSSR